MYHGALYHGALECNCKGTTPFFLAGARTREPSLAFPVDSVATAASAVPTFLSWFFWQEGTSSSDKFFSGGLLVKTIASNGLVVSASLRDTGWKMRADVMVTNKTDQRIDVIPDTLLLDVIVPKAKSLSYQGPEELAESIDRRTRWANAFSGMAAGLATQTTTSESSTSGSVNVYDSSGDTAHGTYDGTTTTTTTSPDHAARQRAWERQRINSQNAASTIDYLNSIVLRRNTLMPGQNVSGAVFFSREKNHDEVVLRVPVGNTVFEFPFRWLKK